MQKKNIRHNQNKRSQHFSCLNQEDDLSLTPGVVENSEFQSTHRGNRCDTIK